MPTRYGIKLTAQAEKTYRELHRERNAKPHFDALSQIINDVLRRNPNNERFRLAGKLSATYRVKQNGLIVDYLILKSKVRIVCISLADENACDAVQVLNSLVQSGTNQQLLRDIGMPEPLIELGGRAVSALPQ